MGKSKNQPTLVRKIRSVRCIRTRCWLALLPFAAASYTKVMQCFQGFCVKVGAL